MTSRGPNQKPKGLNSNQIMSGINHSSFLVELILSASPSSYPQHLHAVLASTATNLIEATIIWVRQ